MKKICPLCNSNNTSFFLEDYKKNHYNKCTNCGFVFQFPISEYAYDDTYWTNSKDPDGNIKDQTEMRDFKIKNWYGDIVNFVKNQKPGKIFDVGCGLGYLLSAIPNSWQKVGSEVSEFAKDSIKKNFPLITIEELDLRFPPKESQREYDVVVCYHVIEHIEKPNEFFKNLSMMVKKNGVLIVGTPNVGSFIAKRFRGNFRLYGEGHLSLFNKQNLEDLFLKNNFQIIKKEYPYFKTDYFNMKNLVRIANTKEISPPFYGNIMTFYGKKNCE